MKKLTKLITCIILLLLVGCSNPLDNTYSKATWLQDVKEIMDSGRTEEAQILGKYIFHANLEKDKIDLSGKTYQQILDESEEWWEDYKSSGKTMFD